jgi:hypothetical protein
VEEGRNYVWTFILSTGQDASVVGLKRPDIDAESGIIWRLPPAGFEELTDELERRFAGAKRAGALIRRSG